MEERSTITVIDSGSKLMKCGSSNRSDGLVTFPTTIGRYQGGVLFGVSRKMIYVGDEILKFQSSPGLLFKRNPVRRGVIENWDDYEQILNYVESSSRLLTDCSALFTEPSVVPRANKEKLTQILFETFDLSNLLYRPTGTCSLYNQNRITTGIAVELGDQLTDISAVYEGQALKGAEVEFPIAVHEITDYFMAMVLKRETNAKEKDSIRSNPKHFQLMESNCYVVQDYQQKSQTNEVISGSFENMNVELGDERWQAPEIYFNPEILNSEKPQVPLHEAIKKCIDACSPELKEMMLRNIVIGGVGATIPGLQDRLQSELKTLFPDQQHLIQISSSTPKLSAWTGGSLFAEEVLTKMPGLMITREDYEETGPTIAHTKI